MKGIILSKKNKLLIIACLVNIAVFIWWSFMVTSGIILPADEWVFAFADSIRSEKITYLMIGFTVLGSGFAGAVLAFLIGIIFWIKERKFWILVLWGGLMGGEIILRSLKYLFQRQRPEPLENLVSYSGYSFPSGHAFAAVVLYGILIYFTMRSHLPEKMKVLIYLLSLFVILCIGFSRIYLGVHYFSDVVGGYLSGSLWVLAVVIISQRLGIIDNKNKY